MARPRVKVCGITRAEDATLAVRLGADAIGFVLWERSPRYVRPEAAAAIGRTVPPFVARVGVVVNVPAAGIAPLVSAAGLDAIQLHGDEMMDDYAGVESRVIKGVALETAADVVRAMAWPSHVTILVDAADRTKRGGTGQRANWALAADLARERRVILAGGLTAENVAEAVELVRPWAVDVSSGVEEAPGIKSERRMREFFQALDRGN